jgi:hypothetical protein
MLVTTVSHLDVYAGWKEREDQSLGDLVTMLKPPIEPTEPMLRGRAFARCMERADNGKAETLSSDGYTFAFTGDFTIESFPRREDSREKDYGGVIVKGRCDRRLGRLIVDDKTTSQFDAERYLSKVQWKYYLDMFDADTFTWYVWECKEMKEPRSYCVHNLHQLTQNRYDGLESDCRALAQDFRDFAAKWLQGYPYK